MQRITPNAVGNTAASSTHFSLPVSFLTVSNVVEQGQCIRQNTTIQIAVVMLQPLADRIFPSEAVDISVIVPAPEYAITIMGITVSFAGNPKMNAIKIMPSSPISLPSGSKKFAHILSTLSPPTVIFAARNIISPAGAATIAALPRTKRVLSNTERTITCEICGFLYGGISSVKDEGTPFKTVSDKSLVATKVIMTPRTIAATNISAETALDSAPPEPKQKKSVIIAIIAGKAQHFLTEILF